MRTRIFRIGFMVKVLNKSISCVDGKPYKSRGNKKTNLHDKALTKLANGSKIEIYSPTSSFYLCFWEYRYLFSFCLTRFRSKCSCQLQMSDIKGFTFNNSKSTKNSQVPAYVLVFSITIILLGIFLRYCYVCVNTRLYEMRELRMESQQIEFKKNRIRKFVEGHLVEILNSQERDNSNTDIAIEEDFINDRR